jgi:dephospho-CoA kinase
MLKVGLTGNIGSGKTMVAGIFSHLGIPVFYADAEARKQFEKEIVRNAILDRFGPGVFGRDGELNRKELAGIAFRDKSKLEMLNTLIHPGVRSDFLDWSRSFPASPYVIYEAAIIFESGHYKEMDKVICVTAPEKLRISRVMKRDGCPREDVIFRMQHQWEESRKAELSDYVIINDGSESVIKQALKIHQDLVQSSK